MAKIFKIAAIISTMALIACSGAGESYYIEEQEDEWQIARNICLAQEGARVQLFRVFPVGYVDEEHIEVRCILPSAKDNYVIYCKTDNGMNQDCEI